MHKNFRFLESRKQYRDVARLVYNHKGSAADGKACVPKPIIIAGPGPNPTRH